MPKQLLSLLLLLFVLGDLAFSFTQHYHQPLDGDLPWIVTPHDDIRPVLDSPLGGTAILNDSSYVNPNRHFSHNSLHLYMRHAPLALQPSVDALDSVYLAAAIVKTLIQLGFILILAALISGAGIRELGFWLAAALVTPFFQNNGFGPMIIIDNAVTYAFFYALPALALLIYLYPLIKRWLHGSSPIPWPAALLSAALAIPLCLSGPLNPGLILVLALVIGLRWLWGFVSPDEDLQTKGALRSFPWKSFYFLAPIALLSLYSLYLAGYDSFAQTSRTPLLEVYGKLPQGLWKQLTVKIGFPLLIIGSALNLFLLSRQRDTAATQRVLAVAKWLGIFILVYLLLLPLGGYRDYRPDVVRHDTLLPMTLGLIFLYGYSAKKLLGLLRTQQLRWYLPLLIGIGLVFTLADKPEWDRTDCERAAIREIAASELETVPLDYDCRVLDWRKLTDPAKTVEHGKALHVWGICDRDKRYYIRE